MFCGLVFILVFSLLLHYNILFYRAGLISDSCGSMPDTVPPLLKHFLNQVEASHSESGILHCNINSNKSTCFINDILMIHLVFHHMLIAILSIEWKSSRAWMIDFTKPLKHIIFASVVLEFGMTKSVSTSIR